MWARVEKISHLSDRKRIKWSKTNLFAYLCSYKSPKGVTMTENNNDYKTVWKNGNKEHYEKHICCFFAIENLKSAITYKCGRVVLFLTSVYFAINKLMLFSYSFHVPSIILTNVYCYILSSMFPFLYNWSRSKPSVVNQMNHHLFEAQKCFFALFNFLKWLHSQCCFDVDQRDKTRRWK